MKKYRIRYGHRFLEVDVPEEKVIAVIEPREVLGVTDENEAIGNALDNPIKSKRLEEIAKGKKTAVVLSDDVTRPTPVYKVMPHVLNRLNKAGIKDENIIVIIALGNHRLNTDSEIEKKIGKEAFERLRVMQHDSKDESMLVNIGKTKAGESIVVNKALMEADVKVGIGNIKLNCGAGYGGGSKIIHPGVSSFESVGESHVKLADVGLEKLMTKRDNPVREYMDEAAKAAGLDFIVNIVPNPKGEIYKVLSGDFIEVHRAGVREFEDISRVEIPETADIIITDAYLEEISLWQTLDTICLVALALKKGGSVAMFAPCHEGIIGDPYFKKFEEVGIKTPEWIKSHMEEIGNKIVAGVSAIAGEALTRAKGWWMFSDGLSKEETIRMGLKYAETPQETVNKAIKSQPPDAKILIINKATAMIPVAKGE